MTFVVLRSIRDHTGSHGITRDHTGSHLVKPGQTLVEGLTRAHEGDQGAERGTYAIGIPRNNNRGRVSVQHGVQKAFL